MTMFVALEGIDGCGKSTVVEGLRRMLGEDRYVFLSDPGSTAFGAALRGILKDRKVPLCANAQLAAFTAARAQMVDEVIGPALEKGLNVVCDRYLLSTYAYQEVWPRVLLDLNDEFCHGILPDVNVIIEVNVDEAMARTSIRTGGDRFDGDRSVMERVAGRYRSKFCPMFGKVVYVDGCKDRQEVLNDVAGVIVNSCGGVQ